MREEGRRGNCCRPRSGEEGIARRDEREEEARGQGEDGMLHDDDDDDVQQQQ